MQVLENKDSITLAISFLEEILNTKDGDTVIKNIKKFKESNNLDEIEIF